MSDDPLVKLADVELRLKVSRRQLLRWIYDGKLKAEKEATGGAPWQVRESELRRFADDKDPWLKLAEVAVRLNKTRRVLLRWIANGKMKAEKLGGSNGGTPWRVRESEVKRLAERHAFVEANDC